MNTNTTARRRQLDVRTMAPSERRPTVLARVNRVIVRPILNQHSHLHNVNKERRRAIRAVGKMYHLFKAIYMHATSKEGAHHQYTVTVDSIANTSV